MAFPLVGLEIGGGQQREYTSPILGQSVPGCAQTRNGERIIENGDRELKKRKPRRGKGKTLDNVKQRGYNLKIGQRKNKIMTEDIAVKIVGAIISLIFFVPLYTDIQEWRSGVPMREIYDTGGIGAVMSVSLAVFGAAFLVGVWFQ